MTKARLYFSDVTWPGRAGDLQASGDVAALGRELSANYVKYHSFLRDKLAAAHASIPKDKLADQDQALAAAAEIQSTVLAEMALRAAYRAGPGGVPFHADPSTQPERPSSAPPVVDGKGRLLSVDEPAPAEPRPDPATFPKPPTPHEIRH